MFDVADLTSLFDDEDLTGWVSKDLTGCAPKDLTGCAPKDLTGCAPKDLTDVYRCMGVTSSGMT